MTDVRETGRVAAGEPGAGRPAEAEPLARFIEQMGLLCEHDNLPRIAGRLLGLLLVEEGAFSLQELADRLNVSRGSISTNARLLTDIGVVERVALPGDRQDYYQLARHPFRCLLVGKVRGLMQAAAVFQDATEAFPPGRESAKARLAAMSKFFRTVADGIAELVERSAEQDANRNKGGR